METEKEYVLSKEHFYYWIECCKLWRNYFGVTDWEFRFFFMESDEDTPRATMVPFDIDNRLMSLRLYDEWDMRPTDYNLFRTAFHEVWEVLLVDLQLLAIQRDYDHCEYDRNHHRLIRRLENSMFDDMWRCGHEIFNFQTDAEGRCTARPEIPKISDITGLSLPGVQCEECDSDGSEDGISPCQRIKGWRDGIKTAGLSLYRSLRRTS